MGVVGALPQNPGSAADYSTSTVLISALLARLECSIRQGSMQYARSWYISVPGGGVSRLLCPSTFQVLQSVGLSALVSSCECSRV